ncbi:hypothetical protein ABT369_46680 [Dactylosporangium sp. NPDC000244]|uniref:hypothetical protein n=1 Tax=Dactylosporangium sp. NPDC000244 TaxID=3154365 RepID=UPI00332A3D0A
MTPVPPPTRVAIDHDDYHAEFVGHTADGRQFFLTTPFRFASDDDPGEEFVALFLFDAAGTFLEAHIDSLGPRATLDRAHAQSVHDARLASLGPVTYGRIEVAPFSVDRFGTTFGLLLREDTEFTEDGGDPWWVELEPGNYMAFASPWDSGEYDT